MRDIQPRSNEKFENFWGFRSLDIQKIASKYHIGKKWNEIVTCRDKVGNELKRIKCGTDCVYTRLQKWEKEMNVMFDKLNHHIAAKVFNNTKSVVFTDILEMVRLVENYNYDYDIAMFMLRGIRYASVSKCSVEANYPFVTGNKDSFFKSSWCSSFQSVLSSEIDMIEKDKMGNSRMGKHMYHKLIAVRTNVEKQIEKEIKAQKRLVAHSGNYELDLEEENTLQGYESSTVSRKEDIIMTDIFFGESFSIILYHGIKRLHKKRPDIGFDIIARWIKTLSGIKCFQLRNVITDKVLNTLYSNEIDIEAVSEELEKMVLLINEYYTTTLSLMWRIHVKLYTFYEKSKWYELLDLKAESLGCYIENDNTKDLFIVSRTVKYLVGNYRMELEGDLKKEYDAEYDFEMDDTLKCVGDLIIWNNEQKKTIHDKKSQIAATEMKMWKEGEKALKVKADTKNIFDNCSKLFAFIHREYMRGLEL